MSLQVNFTTHGHDLKATYESILRPSDPQNSNNWAMFGYDKGTNDLKVLGQGDGGLEELEDEFMDGKIQYAFARIIDPNTELNKFILIAWCGDGVPESKKGLFNSHLADVSNFLKGYHLQINARCEADVTPAQILKRVNEGSGSKYSIHKETYEQERIRPLQSAYKRTEIPDIASMQRNPTKPEPAPKYGLAKTFGSTPSTPLPTTTPAPVTRSWNAPIVNTPPPISAVKPVERTWKSSGASSYTGTAGVTFNKVAPPSSLLNYGNNNSSSSSPASSTIPATRNDPAMNKAQQMRLEREAREKEERERIKREIEASEARDRQAQGQSNAFKEADEKRQREQREQEELQRSQDRSREEREAREKEERARADAEDAARSAREEMRAREQAAQEEDQKRQMEVQQRQREKEEKEAADKRAKQQREEEEEKSEKKRLQAQEDERRRREEEEDEEREHAAQAATAAVQATAQVAASQVSHAGHEATPDSVSAVVLYAYEQAEENEMSLIEGEVIVNVTELDVGWWSGESIDGARSGLFPANYVEVIENTQDHAAAAPAAIHYEEEEYAAHHVDAPISSGHAHAEGAAAASSGPSAVALYDYAAGEPNELSFAEGDVITDIEFVTDDWWNGTCHGASGLFPSNYVEIQQ
ncbi:hypothetical protein BGZ96_000917 [Linnemannia gamsii]|uniref:Drebrin-like protein n=1 Tax=Linnemannia gamsii TaxID=64522 RepID=A0ABQ7KAT7_9FUNG|nr:hypothetical protein BGZ96_000917 [Linnemannia gamsii]